LNISHLFILFFLIKLIISQIQIIVINRGAVKMSSSSFSYINNNSFINVVNHENGYNHYSINRNYWNEIIYMIHERNLNEMIVPVHNRDYLLGVIAAAEAVEPVVVASASSTFERFNIDVEHHVVVVVSPCQSQASSQNCHGDGDDSNACCSICLKCLNAEQEEEEEEKQEAEKQEKQEEEEMVKTKCAHIFHSKCLAKWVIHKTTCPMCRNSLTKKIT
jgi:hypothetical protein